MGNQVKGRRRVGDHMLGFQVLLGILQSVNTAVHRRTNIARCIAPNGIVGGVSG